MFSIRFSVRNVKKEMTYNPASIRQVEYIGFPLPLAPVSPAGALLLA